MLIQIYLDSNNKKCLPNYVKNYSNQQLNYQYLILLQNIYFHQPLHHPQPHHQHIENHHNNNHIFNQDNQYMTNITIPTINQLSLSQIL